MSARGGTRIRAIRKPVVVLAGEDGNDRKSLRVLLEEFCPQMRGRIVGIKDSVRLRDASGSSLTGRVDILARKARARAVREDADLACVFVHEDLDATDGPAYDETHARVQQALTRALGNAHYVLAVEELEAWLLLFPDALTSLVSSWKVPRQYRNRDTGTLADPKRILMHDVSNATRRYRESDAPDVLARSVELGLVSNPRGRNRSWTRLRTDADDCARRHIPQPRRHQ